MKVDVPENVSSVASVKVLEAAGVAVKFTNPTVTPSEVGMEGSELAMVDAVGATEVAGVALFD